MYIIGYMTSSLLTTHLMYQYYVLLEIINLWKMLLCVVHKFVGECITKIFVMNKVALKTVFCVRHKVVNILYIFIRL